jgi:hypothetical protein
MTDKCDAANIPCVSDILHIADAANIHDACNRTHQTDISNHSKISTIGSTDYKRRASICMDVFLRDAWVACVDLPDYRVAGDNRMTGNGCCSLEGLMLLQIVASIF